MHELGANAVPQGVWGKNKAPRAPSGGHGVGSGVAKLAWGVTGCKDGWGFETVGEHDRVRRATAIANAVELVQRVTVAMATMKALSIVWSICP